MQVNTLIFNDFSENTYVIFDETNEAVIIDPGCFYEKEKNALVQYFERKNLKPVKIINTHCHIDHVLGVDFLKEKYGIEFYASKKDEYIFDFLLVSAKMYGLAVDKAPKIDKYIAEGDIISFGNSELKILDVPGHTLGHIAFYSEKEKFVITGDVIFKDSIGRTDLPGGDLDILLDSIKNKLFLLGEDFTVFPGHGEPTNIGTEMMHNPFLRFD